MTIKRTYNIPLRKEFSKAPAYKKSKKAVTGLITFLKKHMKSDNVKIGKNLNEKIWQNGIKNPPHHVEVVAIKDDEGNVKTELVGFEKELEKKPEPKETKTEDKKEKETKQDKPEDTENKKEKTKETKPAEKEESLEETISDSKEKSKKE